MALQSVLRIANDGFSSFCQSMLDSLITAPFFWFLCVFSSKKSNVCLCMSCIDWTQEFHKALRRKGSSLDQSVVSSLQIIVLLSELSAGSH